MTSYLIRHQIRKRATQIQTEFNDIFGSFSGQLMLGSDPDEPPTSTIGPKLESYLKPGIGQSSRTQKPYFVLTKKKDEGEEEKPEADKASENVGLLPMLFRSAKDDLKFVGNVIKYALA